jgi:cytochrome b561
VLGCFLSEPTLGWAQTRATEPAATQSTPATSSPAKTETPAAGGDLGFDLFADGAKESPTETAAKAQAAQEIEKKARIRRKMLTTHQAFGFSTLAAFAATLVIGQLNYQDKYVNGQFSGRFESAHLGLGIGTTVLFATTGSLALFSPDPYPKKYRLDSAMVHRVAMALATAGMVTQMVLGPIIDYRAGYLNQPRLALGHLITGYASFAFMATGTIAYMF